MSYREACAVIEEHRHICRLVGGSERFCRICTAQLQAFVLWLEQTGRLEGFPGGLTLDDVEEFLAQQAMMPPQHRLSSVTERSQRAILEAFLWWALERPVKKPA